ncbi:hypothetical protein PALB_19890 [Pseudoalteromonas luteoviolacea B = ATCC 29581]|nr:hypothetical protein PALB_19890 [Pseudoalteromonas luteoviolacea B = ATCC 29581]
MYSNLRAKVFIPLNTVDYKKTPLDQFLIFSEINQFLVKK